MGTCSQCTLRGSAHGQSTNFLAEVGQSASRYIEEKSLKPHNHTARAKKCSQKKQVASPRLRLIPLPLEVVGRLRRCPVFAVDNLRASTADTCGPTSVRSMCHSRRSALSKFIEICPSRWAYRSPVPQMQRVEIVRLLSRRTGSRAREVCCRLWSVPWLLGEQPGVLLGSS